MMLKKILFWFALLLTGVIAAFSVFLTIDFFVGAESSQIKEIMGRFMESNGILAAGLFIGISALSSIMPPMATVTFLPPALVVWPKALVLAYVLLGWLLGGALLYFLIRYVARPILEQFISFKKVDFFVASLPSRLTFWFAVLFRIAIPAEIPTLTFGLIKYPFLSFLLVSAIGELPSAISYIYLADNILAKKFSLAILIFALSAILLILAIFFFAQKFKRLTGQTLTKEVAPANFHFVKVVIRYCRRIIRPRP